MSRFALVFWSMAAGLCIWAFVLSLRLNPITDLSRLKESGTRSAARAALPRTGAELYVASCAGCHQARGEGRHPVFPPLVGSDWVTGNPDVLTSLTLHGVSGPMDVNGITYTGLMPPFAHLTDRELALILSHIRTSWGNTAGRLTEADITAVRTATAGRQVPWTADELGHAQSAETAE